MLKHFENSGNRWVLLRLFFIVLQFTRRIFCLRAFRCDKNTQSWENSIKNWTALSKAKIQNSKHLKRKNSRHMKEEGDSQRLHCVFKACKKLGRRRRERGREEIKFGAEIKTVKLIFTKGRRIHNNWSKKKKWKRRKTWTNVSGCL